MRWDTPSTRLSKENQKFTSATIYIRLLVCSSEPRILLLCQQLYTLVVEGFEKAQKKSQEESVDIDQKPCQRPLNGYLWPILAQLHSEKAAIEKSPRCFPEVYRRTKCPMSWDTPSNQWMRNVFAVAAVLRRISAHMVHDVGPSISRSESGWGREGKGHVFKTENNCHVCEEKVMWWQRHTNSICKWRRQFQRQNWQRPWRKEPLLWHLHGFLGTGKRCSRLGLYKKKQFRWRINCNTARVVELCKWRRGKLSVAVNGYNSSDYGCDGTRKTAQ